MSGKKGGSKASSRNSNRRNGKAWGRNHDKPQGPKPKSPEKAARRQAQLDAKRAGYLERKDKAEQAKRAAAQMAGAS